MKLIIVGATGFVASELIRQALRQPRVTSIVAVARRPVKADDGVDASKLKSVIIEDYTVYPDNVIKELSGADACIWTVAITPSKSRAFPWEEFKKVCHDSTMAGIKAIHGANPAKPSRFLYLSGSLTERDQTKRPAMYTEYLLMRGETENQLLAFAKDHPGEVEVCVAKPAMIPNPINMWRTAISWAASARLIPSVTIQQLSAALLQQVSDGFEKEPLLNEDLVRIGQAALEVQETAAPETKS